MQSVEILGTYDDWKVQTCRDIAAELGCDYDVRTMFEPDYLEVAKKYTTESPLVLLRAHGEAHHVGGLEAFEELATEHLGRKPVVGTKTDHEKKAKTLFLEALRLRNRKFCYIDVKLKPSMPPKKLLIELYDKECPKTCDHFISFCTGERELRYKGLPFHRILKDGYAQSGGFEQKVDPIPDEAFISLDRPGVLAMVHNDEEPHSCATHFIITLAPQPWLKTKCVAIGAVIRGLSTLRLMNNLPTEHGRPVEGCSIATCGEVFLENKGFGL